MKTLSRLALAVLLTGAVSLPALAQVAQTVPVPKQQITRVAAGPETGKPDAGKQGGTKPGIGKPAGQGAVMTDKAGSHAPVTQAPPVADAPAAPKTN